MSGSSIDEARRQIDICNACRYCEGFCSVFPSINRNRTFSDGDISQLANLCHNCRGCYYACQFIPPHEFAINIPAVLAEVRQKSWQSCAWPGFLAGWFKGNALMTTLLMILSMVFFIGLIQAFPPSAGEGFYALLSHNQLVLIFMPAFLLPLVAIGIGVRNYWRSIGGDKLRWSDLKSALADTSTMKNLDGGHGDGCNFEDQDRFSNVRRYFHQATMWGFLLCFAATSSATIMHYLLNMPAPYPLFSVPKLLGMVGGMMLCVGTLGLAALKLKADRALAASKQWGSEMTFILLLFFVSATGLGLYVAAGSGWVEAWLTVHLASVLTLFLLMPYSKMVHGFYRLAALCRNAQTSSRR